MLREGLGLIMSKNTSPKQLASIWGAAMIVIAALSIVGGIGLTLGNIELLILASLVPPAVMLALWPAPQPATFAQMLHSVPEARR